MATYIDLV